LGSDAMRGPLFSQRLDSKGCLLYKCLHTKFEEMKSLTKKTIRFYLRHLKKLKWLAVFTTATIVLAVLTTLAMPFLYKELINTLAEATVRELAVPSLIKILIFIVSLDFFSSLCWRGALYSISYLEAKTMSGILDECFEHLHKHSYNFFNDNFAGSLVKKINRMARAFEDLADNFFFEFLTNTIRIIVSVAVLFYLSTILGVTLLAWILIFIVANYYLSLYKMRKYDMKRIKADTKVTGVLADTITNNMNIKLFSTSAYETKEFKKVTGNWFTTAKNAWFFSNHMELVQAFFMIGLNFLIFYFAIGLWRDGVLTVGDFALIQIYLLDLFMHLWNFGRIIRRAYERMADASEMTEILNTPVEVKDKRGAKLISIRHGKVEFKNVNFSYDGNKDDGVLNDLSFKINPSEKIALIGPSGGGKSTIMKLLLRLFDVSDGQILIDGQDVAKVTQDSLRSQLSLVPQDPILFHRTLFENIGYGCLDASEEEVVAAAKMAHCHEFISQFPEGYGTYVGERGVKLSGGERQRVAIARAILSNTKILLLDEATSNLDSESEKMIQDALKNLMKNKTTFVVAHRLSTIVSMDKILVLDKGKIVESGSHKTLIRNEDSLYKKLWDIQVGGYLE